jgi:putative ABC transport system ATP-binding protein
MIEFEQATRTFGHGHVAVDAIRAVDLTVAAGELVAVMGPSGSGKSTLLSLAGGLDTCTGGSVRIGGADLGALTWDERAKLRLADVGYVFQDLNLLPGLTAAENVAFPLELAGMGAGHAYRTAVAKLDEFGIGDLADRFPDDLSGGERQRAAIARALIGDRKVVLADEPTGALDSVNGENVMRSLREACERGVAGLAVTHDAHLAAWAHRVIFLRDGRLVDESKPAPLEEIVQ